MLSSERICRALNRTCNSERESRVARKWVNNAYGIEFGMESIDLPGGGICWYVNRGDTYEPTLCRVSTDDFGRDAEWIEASWGGVYEEAELRYEENSGLRRCPNCGSWTDDYDDGSQSCDVCTVVVLKGKEQS